MHSNSFFQARAGKIFVDFSIPIFVLFSATVLLMASGADLAIEDLFYSPAAGWYLRDDRIWALAYDFANVPAFAIAVFATLLLVCGLFNNRAGRHRNAALFFLLLLALGPGLLVNAGFKDHWGRPRPLEIENFGGQAEFVPAWVKGEAGKNSSFPSGHAAVAFYLFSPFFVLRRTSRKWALFFLGAGLLFGTGVGIGRMVQGAHFATDVLWAGGLIYLSGLVLFYCLGLDREASP